MTITGNEGYEVYITVFHVKDSASGMTVVEEWQADADSVGLNEALKKATAEVKKEVFKHGAG